MRHTGNAALILLLIGVAAAAAYFIYPHYTAQKEISGILEDAGEQGVAAECRSIRNDICTAGSTPSAADYPDQCFADGEHVLDGPYTC